MNCIKMGLCERFEEGRLERIRTARANAGGDCAFCPSSAREGCCSSREVHIILFRP